MSPRIPSLRTAASPACALLLAAGLLVGGVATADQHASSGDRYDPRAAHRAADLNEDGYVDREEFQRRMMELFFMGDADRDGFMTRAELERTVAYPHDFDEADWKDGKISFPEFVRVRFADYDTVDTDGDGLLSMAEVVAVYEKGGVR